jgi:hypothetical protein
MNNGADIRLLEPVFTVGFPAKVLHRYFQAFLKPHRVGNMPAVPAESLSRVL